MFFLNGVDEKYMGDVLLQKSYTVDFLTKKKKKNNGELTQYYIKMCIRDSRKGCSFV